MTYCFVAIARTYFFEGGQNLTWVIHNWISAMERHICAKIALVRVEGWSCGTKQATPFQRAR